MTPYDVLMRPSVEFIAGLESGSLIRYGAILKDVASGEVVGHLKEAGDLGMSTMAMGSNPIAMVTSIASSVASNVQLFQLQKAVNALGLVCGVGAAASVASLGVSVVGFAAVVSQLKKISTKVDANIALSTEIKTSLSQQGLKWDIASLSELETASNAVDKALSATGMARRRELLREASGIFAEKRNYFGLLLGATRPFTNGEMELSLARDLFARFQTAALGEIHAEFMLGDFGACKTAISFAKRQMQEVGNATAREMFMSRAGKSSTTSLNPEHDSLKVRCLENASLNYEAIAQAETAHIEIDYVERLGLDPIEYIGALKNAKPDIVLLNGRP